MRVYVTGASGFLGRHVVRALEERGHEVKTVGRSLHEDCIVHLAACCGGIGRNIAKPYQMLRDNLESDLKAVGSADHFIGIGSVCMYPVSAPLPLREEDIWNGYPEPTNGPYGIAKRVQLELLRAAHAQYGLPYTFLVLANLYGPGDHFDREDAHVIPMLVKRAVEAKEQGKPLVVWGDGTPTRDFLYVEDAAKAIVAAVEAGPQNQAVNVGTGDEHSINAIAEILADIVQCDGLDYDHSKPKGQARRALDVSRIKNLWSLDMTPLGVGLGNTVQWYLDNRPNLVNACSN